MSGDAIVTVVLSEEYIGVVRDPAADVLCFALSSHDHAMILSEGMAESVTCCDEVLSHTAYPS